ncbi:hypothetical protein BS47DRAFT_1357615 [Hydnum rufescens UP504]|uniref:Uncharacterized protein n=1 Tax=Hydnum rufescens UP504 TaxID=1448309 RepID=A0A9P6B9V6_9AGAM|nr:hypothetical protein BS47DRAFT_1357615 [Hydnum rufescens UP504]
MTHPTSQPEKETDDHTPTTAGVWSLDENWPNNEGPTSQSPTSNVTKKTGNENVTNVTTTDDNMPNKWPHEPPTHYGGGVALYRRQVPQLQLPRWARKWLEALGDLTQSRMAVAIHIANHAVSDPTTLVGEPIPTIVLPIKAPASHINTSPLPLVGIPATAAKLGDKDGWDTWHMTTWDWYVEVLKDTPGTGCLQYYLGTLSWDLKGEELCTMYRFIKSLVVEHLFDRGHKAILDCLF